MSKYDILKSLSVAAIALMGSGSAHAQSFEAKNIKLASASHVVIVPSTDGRTTISTQADPSGSIKLQVAQNGDSITVKQLRGTQAPTASCGSPHIVVAAPAGSNLTAFMGGNASLTSSVALNNANVTLLDTASANLNATNVKITAKDASTAEVVVNGGDLTIETSSGRNIQTKGCYNNVTVHNSGVGNVFTFGQVNGSYAATSDNGDITHRGGIKGQLTQQENSVGKVSLSNLASRTKTPSFGM